MRQNWISLSLVLLLTVMTDWASISAAKPKDAYRVMTCNIRTVSISYQNYVSAGYHLQTFFLGLLFRLNYTDILLLLHQRSIPINKYIQQSKRN